MAASRADHDQGGGEARADLRVWGMLPGSVGDADRSGSVGSEVRESHDLCLAGGVGRSGDYGVVVRSASPNIRAGRLLSRLPGASFEDYFGICAVPVTVKRASDLSVVSRGWAPPMLSVYLPARMERLPWSSTLERERGLISSLTALVTPGSMWTRSKPTREWIGPPS